MHDGQVNQSGPSVPDVRRAIAEQLDVFGPAAGGRRALGAASLADARAYCRALAFARRENFTVMSSLVPAELRDDFAAVYAFCRWADDLGDEAVPTGHVCGAGAVAAPAMGEVREHRLALLSWWRNELEAAVAGRPRHAVMVALAETMRARKLDAGPFHRLIDAFELDQRKSAYATWDDLVAYCALSANPVGEIVLGLGGVTRAAHPQLLTLSDAACTALQITNHLQDVRRDVLERGRAYLPADVTGVGAEEFPPLIAAAVEGDAAARARLSAAAWPVWQRTKDMYLRAAALPRQMRGLAGDALASGPGGGAGKLAPVVWLLIAGGRATHDELARGGLRGAWRRDGLSKAGAGALVLGALMRRAWWSVLPTRRGTNGADAAGVTA